MQQHDDTSDTHRDYKKTRAISTRYGATDQVELFERENHHQMREVAVAMRQLYVFADQKPWYQHTQTTDAIR